MIMQEWDPNWKVPMNKIEKKYPENDTDEQGNEHGNKQGNEQGRDTEDVQHMVPEARHMRKYKVKRPTPSSCNNMKSHKPPSIYTLTNDDID
jgi:hypothetical protein